MEQQVLCGQSKLEEARPGAKEEPREWQAQAENVRLSREGEKRGSTSHLQGHRLQEQLVEALREASRGGDRLLESFERQSEAQRQLARLTEELAQARQALGGAFWEGFEWICAQEVAEVTEALAEEQAHASAVRCRLREPGAPRSSASLAEVRAHAVADRWTQWPGRSLEFVQKSRLEAEFH